MTGADRARREWLAPFEVLHFAFVLFSGCARLERSQVATLAGTRILLARVQPVSAGWKLANHGAIPSVGEPMNADPP